MKLTLRLKKLSRIPNPESQIPTFRLWPALWGLLFLFGTGAPSLANPLNVFGFGSRGIAMGNAQTAAVDDCGAVYYNLAAMTRIHKENSFGFIYAWDDVAIDLKERPVGIDPPGYSNRAQDRHDREDILDTQGFFFGLVHDFWSEHFRVGVGVFLPANNIQVQQTHFNNEMEQYFSNTLDFELLGGRTQRQVVNFGIAYEFFKWMSLGAGLSMLQDSITNSYAYQPSVFDLETIYINLDNRQVQVFTGEFGALFSITPRWRLGAVYRQAADFPIHGRNYIQVGGLVVGKDQVYQDLDILIQYQPEQGAFGVAYEATGKWKVDLDTTWYHWSQYRDNHDYLALPKLKNTFTTRLGGEYRVKEWFAVRAGYYYEPSPITDTRGRTNYVDNDRHVLSFGAGFDTELRKRAFTIDWHLQVHLLSKRTVTKDLNDEDPVIDESPNTPGFQTGNPGYPGWTSKGMLISSGINFTFRNVFLK